VRKICKEIRRASREWQLLAMSRVAASRESLTTPRAALRTNISIIVSFYDVPESRLLVPKKKRATVAGTLIEHLGIKFNMYLKIRVKFNNQDSFSKISVIFINT